MIKHIEENQYIDCADANIAIKVGTDQKDKAALHVYRTHLHGAPHIYTKYTSFPSHVICQQLKSFNRV